jgi:hypothetical protein
MNASFRDYKSDGANWITLSSGEFYPDILVDACKLYRPVLELFGQLIKTSESSKRLLLEINEISEQWMRTQLMRVFRKYVSPETPVEMLKKKKIADWICDQFGKYFRPIVEVQKAFNLRPIPDEALCAVLWEYKDRGIKGYDMTEKMFELLRERFPTYKIIGPERAGRDILMGEIFENYSKPDRPVDFVISKDDQILAIGLARYDSDRGGAQEDDRTGGYLKVSEEILGFAKNHKLKTKVIFVNDGPGLLLGSMWDDYSYLEETSKNILVVTLRMITERITEEWLNK